MSQSNNTEQALHALITFIQANDYKGYDPYDLRGHPLFLHMQKNIVGKGLVILFNSNIPLLARKLLRIKKSENNKTYALVLRSYCLLYKKTKNEEYLKEAEKVFERLMKGRNEKYNAWGYPFNWQSKTLIPKNTPSIVVTSFCTQALLDFYDLTQNKQALEAAKEAGDFMLNDLNRLESKDGDSDTFCFSYTPVDDAFVHNANVLGAAFLARLSSVTGTEKYLTAATKAMNFTINQQRENGSFEYRIDSQVQEEFIDGYHTGFVLEAIYDFIEYSKPESSKYKEALTKGLKFYKENLFHYKTIPLYRTTSPLPIDIHAVAEALVLFKKLHKIENSDDYIENIFSFVMQEMHHKDGHFYYWLNHHHALRHKQFRDKRLKILNLLSFPKKLKISYMRWSESWMLWALSNLVGRIK